MKVEFQVSFNSIEGQDLYVVGSCYELGNGNLQNALPLKFQDGTWKASVNIEKKQFTYHYFYKESWSNKIYEEWEDRRFAKNIPSDSKLILKDSWFDLSNPEFYLNTKFFDTVTHNIKKSRAVPYKNTNCVFSIKVKLNNRNERLCLLGSTDSLNNWKITNPILMNHLGDDLWQCSVQINDNYVTYKYGVFDIKKKKFIYFEAGDDRALSINSTIDCYRVYDVNFRTPQQYKWKGSGVAIPLFSLKSEKSEGIGDFLDLIPLADFVKKSGQTLIQLLPVYDTTAYQDFRDSYPYSAISVHALHPIYIRLNELTVPLSQEFKKEVEQKAKELNESSDLQYSEVIAFKMSYLRKAYQERISSIKKDKSFKTFIKENTEWLKAYAVFSMFRDKFNTPKFNEWEEFSTISNKELNQFFKPIHQQYDNVLFYCFVQWQLDLQFKKAVEYLHRKSIALKGDLPIGIFRYGVDAWFQPELFDSTHTAGAPPDEFSIIGQNWGFPIYNWDKMQANHFKWWKERFNNMSKYFDAFRIDHILGFFRIWQIPTDAIYGTLGYFKPALPQTYEELKGLGLNLPFHRLVKPYISKDDIIQKFGDKSKTMFELYFETIDGWIQLKEEYDTQVKVKENVKDLEVQTYLLGVLTNVLFIQERHNPTHLHPRINLHRTSSFSSLDNHSKDILNRNYHAFFFERHDEFWKQKGLDKLPDLKKATKMLTCGEDLGMVPKVVPDVMSDIGILSLQIQRMPDFPGSRFNHMSYAPYLSVVSPSTHDTSTLRQWWIENRENTQYYYNQILKIPGDAPTTLETDIAKKIIQDHFDSPAMLAIIPLQDLFAMNENLRVDNIDSERINMPDKMDNNWKYRMHLTLEKLLSQNKFIQDLYQMNKKGHRI